MSVPEHIADLGGDIVSVRADNPSALTLTGTRTYVIGQERVAILDPGPADADHLDRIDTVVNGRSVVAVCLTHSHRDHSAAAAAAAERWGTLRASAETLKRIDQDGEAIEDEALIELDEGRHLMVLATPGHCGDHLCFLRPDSRDLFTGDLILGKGSTIIVHPDGSVRAYLTSLARLVALRPQRLLPAHGPVVKNALKRVEACRIHRLERTKHVLRAVEAGAATVDAIREAVYWNLPTTHHAAAELSIRAYLAYLAEEGHEIPAIGD